jgi:hypothetical protein
MRFIQVQDNTVVNVSIDNNRDAAPDGWQQHDTAQIGWSFDGTDFVAPVQPPEPPPTREDQEASRRAAYAAEADPIAMQMLRDEATKEEWLAKIEEIKARFPYPEEQP